MQWKLPTTLSSFVQRAGRAARGEGRTGLAVLLVEKSVYKFDLQAFQDQRANASGKKKGNVREATEYPKSKDKEYAVKHGVLRGSYGGGSDVISDKIEVPIDFYSINEGLYAFVQTLGCRRQVLTKIYENEDPSESLSRIMNNVAHHTKIQRSHVVIFVVQSFLTVRDLLALCPKHERTASHLQERWMKH